MNRYGNGAYRVERDVLQQDLLREGLQAQVGKTGSQPQELVVHSAVPKG